MSRRIYSGLMPGGGYDFRISRPGYDAKTDDVTDPSKISFAASRNGTEAKLTESGTITTIDEWYPLQYTYAEPPEVIYWLNRGGQRLFNNYSAWQYVFDANAFVQEFDTEFAIVIETNRIKAFPPRPVNTTSVARNTVLSGGDTITYILSGVIT